MRLELSRESRVWIYCPARAITGGPEAQHQLSRTLVDLGVDARVVYFPEKDRGYPVPSPYRVYRPILAPRAADCENDIVIVPEILTGKLRSFTKARRIVWWLSVDNYLSNRSPKEIVRGVVKGFGLPLDLESMQGFGHLCQSHYAQTFLAARGIRETALVTDYLRDDFLAATEAPIVAQRENLILYNPKKGWELTQQLIRKCCNSGRWQALDGMETEQVIGLMRRAKVYVDFGPHPGRDRMPREAAVCGCCVITGRRGSAANSSDIPISDFYKVDETSSHWVDETLAKIHDVLVDFPDHHKKFSLYRRWVKGQKSEFVRQVAAVFRRDG